jgi:hypothetical protein
MVAVIGRNSLYAWMSKLTLSVDDAVITRL